jgi:hypothetical protein
LRNPFTIFLYQYFEERVIPSFSSHQRAIGLNHHVMIPAPLDYRTLLAEGVKLDLVHRWELEGLCNYLLEMGNATVEKLDRNYGEYSRALVGDSNTLQLSVIPCFNECFPRLNAFLLSRERIVDEKDVNVIHPKVL